MGRRFILLTRASGQGRGNQRWINLDYVLEFWRDPGRDATCVFQTATGDEDRRGGYLLFVRETPEEIVAQINEG